MASVKPGTRRKLAPVASARTMEQIASGKGRRPKPFMLSKAGAAAAQWHSRGAPK